MKTELEKLRRELEYIEADFVFRTNQLKNKIFQLEASEQSSHETAATITQPSQSSQLNQQENAKQAKQAAVASGNEQVSSWNEQTVSPVFAEAAQAFFTRIAPLLGPLSGAFEKVLSTYRHYQKQGKAPVFFMTLAGITALVFGFGYLLQYGFNQYFSAAGKVLLGFCIAVGVSSLGIFIARRKADMFEYGTAIITLGIVLGYLCAYFAGPYYQLLPPVAGFFVLILITAAAYIIAHIFETRVVTVLSLLGGALTPVIMGQTENLALGYFVYLLVLSAVTLVLAYKIRWPVLANLTFLVSVGMIEWTLITPTPTAANTGMGVVLIVHGFFYLFCGHLLQQFKQRFTFQRSDITLAAANLIFLLFSLYQIVPSEAALGGYCAANGLVFLVFTFFPHRLLNADGNSAALSKLRGVGFLVAGVLFGFAILTLLSPELMGVLWGIEGILLLYLGFMFSDRRVRQEAYGLILLSSAQMLYQTSAWIIDGTVASPAVFLLSPGYGWLNLLGLTLSIHLCAQLLLRYKTHCTENENRLTYGFQEILTLLYAAAFVFSLAIQWVDAIWVAAIIPLFYSLYRAQQYNLPYSEILGLSLYGLFLVPIFISAAVVGNAHFSQQSLVAQIARVEAFACLWLIAEFYHRYYPNTRLIKVAITLRQLFFLLIPLLFLPKLLRSAPAYFPLGTWLSLVICLLIYNRLRYASLRLELIAIAIGAMATTTYACVLVQFEDWDGYAMPALLAGNLVFAGIVFYWKGLQKRLIAAENFLEVRRGLSPLMTMGIYFWGLSLFIVVYGFTGSAFYGLAMAAIYLAWIFIKSPPFVPLRKTLLICYGLVGLITSVVILVYLATVIFFSLEGIDVEAHFSVVTVLLCSGLLVYLRRPQSIKVWQKVLGQRLHLWYFHSLIVLAYNALFLYWFQDWGTPALSITLVIHGTLILFQTLNTHYQKLLPLAITLYAMGALKILLLDMAGFSMVQKIIAFMGIGIVLLGAAYLYQRIRKPLELAL